MYFESRAAAGRLLADQLKPKYRYENCAVLALSDGGVMVGAQVAAYLHSVLTMLLFERIKLPGEFSAIGGIAQSGAFTYDSMLAAGEIEEVSSEFRGYLDEAQMSHLSHINRLLGEHGVVSNKLLYGQNIIIVSDGFVTGLSLDVAIEFLKPIKVNKIIVATPLATPMAVDKMHAEVDEIYCLNVQDGLEDMGVDHYYEQAKKIDHDKIIETISNEVLNWK